jgi:stage II sporulation protein P
VRIYFIGGFPRRRHLPAALIFSIFALLAGLAWFLGLGDLLVFRSFRQVEWGKYILASVLPMPAAAAPVVAWSDDWPTAELQHPRGWLEAQMPILVASRGGGRALPALAQVAEEGEEELEPLPPPQDKGPQEEISKEQRGSVAPEAGQARDLRDAEVQVFVYTTHNAESYVPDYGVAKVQGRPGGVTRVAATLVEALEERGIRAVLSPTIHDSPDFSRSYYNSETTVKRALIQYPSLRLLVDVHRDAGRSQPDTALIEGQRVAQILLVVGTNHRLPHPNWQENLAFAKKVAAKMEELYPGLCRGVRIQDGRYNQHLHPRAILVEMGNHLNSLAEAEAAASFLARVLKEVI